MPIILLLLKGYRKFVPRIQSRCWVLQIVILENDHRICCISLKFTISCISLKLTILSEYRLLFIPIGLCFIKRPVWRVKMFYKTVNKAWNLFNLFEQSLENSAENFKKFWFLNFHLENSRTWIFILWNHILQTQTSLLQPILVHTYIYNNSVALFNSHCIVFFFFFSFWCKYSNLIPQRTLCYGYNSRHLEFLVWFIKKMMFVGMVCFFCSLVLFFLMKILKKQKKR